MIVAILLVCVVAFAHALPSAVLRFEKERAPLKLRFDPYDVTWEQFKAKYGRSYETRDVEDKHREVFLDNVKRIEQHNWDYFQMKKSYYLGINHFTDMTVEEYRQFNKLMKRPVASSNLTKCTQFLPPLNLALPVSVDWREKGFVTPVKNQGQCGSCWAFSTTGSLEGQHFRKTKDLKSLSEQQLVDCSGNFGNQGCNGGLMDFAFEYINSVGGLETEEDYPYEAEVETCHFAFKKVVADLSSCVDVTSEDEYALMEAVAAVGPVSVAIDASHQSFQMYAGGVYDEPECSSTALDHGVLTVGYGSEKGKEYWLVKNSWGTSWGDEGYIKMTRNNGNQCGIATQASYPVV